MARILIIDDEENIRRSLKTALEKRNHDTVTASGFHEGDEFARAGFDVIFLDVMMPDGNGLDLLKTFLSRDSRQIVVMISGHANIDTAVEAIRAGAYDFIEKPLSLDRVLITIDNATRTSRLLNQQKQLTSRLYGEFIGENEKIRRLRDDVVLSSAKTTRFLITGENGTGKELIAHLIHRSGQYADGPFVAVNCAALPAELVEAELFGHLPGAFTGAGKGRKGRFLEADRGSIFLDEISEMPLPAQAKILRVVETRTVTAVGADKPVKIECNIIAASNRNLEKQVEEEKFRQDLLYRLNVVQFHIPPLRERRDDIPLLAMYFLNLFSAETKTGIRELAGDALDFLKSLDYPGNTRELKNLMERVNIYCDKRHIGQADLKNLIPRTTAPGGDTLKEAVSTFERDYINTAVARNSGNISAAARELGLERSHLYKKIRKYEDNDE